MNEPREDGPGIQKLFAKLDGPAKFDTVIPDEIAGMANGNGDPIEDHPHMGWFEVMTPADADGNVHTYRVHVDGRIEGFPEGCAVFNGILPLLDDDEAAAEIESQTVGPINYAKKLHQAGEAAILIASNTCEAEFAYGNPCNIPEPVLGWYTMTLAYQLLLFEAVERPRDEREEHAGQLAAARKAFSRHDTPYAKAVKADIAEALNTRYTPKALAGEDLTYGGLVSAPAPVRAANDDPAEENR